MKKIILALFMITGAAALAVGTMTQNELLSRMKPHLIEGEIYEKFQKIEAREASGGEIIETVTGDGLETRNTAAEGDYIVRNRTKAGERYIIKRDKFLSRYEYLEDADGGWKTYKATGRIKGVEVDDKLLKTLERGEEFYFMAPWGQKMVVKKGDYLVSPLDYSEVYRIARKEFFETYQREKK